MFLKICLWYMMQKYFEDKAPPFKDPENVPITDVQTNKIPEGHYKKTKTLLWMAPITYLIFCFVAENCVIKQAKNYIPIKFVEPCNFPDIISVEKYIELKVEFGKATKGLAAINSVVKFDDIPPEFSRILLNKKQNLSSSYSILKAKFYYQKEHRSECYKENVEKFSDKLEIWGLICLFTYFICFILICYGIKQCFGELADVDVTPEEWQSYNRINIWLQVFIVYNSILGLLNVLEWFKSYPENGIEYFKEFPL